MELWNKKYPDFIGYNCRITAFDLMKDKISVKADAKVNASNLFMDQDALKHAPAKKFTRKQKHAFETLYSTLNTSYTTDVDTHIKKQKKAWKQNEVKISGTKASLITVVFHSSFGENENEPIHRSCRCIGANERQEAAFCGKAVLFPALSGAKV